MNPVLQRVRRGLKIAFATAVGVGLMTLWGEAAPASGPAEQAQSSAQRSKRSGTDFSLLPNALRQNPDLCETVFTEVSPEGKKLPAVSLDHPQYYVLKFAGFDRLYGPATAIKISTEDIEHVLRDSLGKTGYVAGDAAHPPSLLILYTWGATSHLNETGPTPVELFLKKASLVGGESYEALMAKLIREKTAQLGPYGRLPSPNRFGESNNIMDPFYLYEKRDDRNEFLLDQVKSPLYFIIASAFDFKAATSKKLVLLWRTRMTVDESGVSDAEALPALIARASSFFGRETLEPRGFRRRTGDAWVEVGTPVIVDDAGNAEPAAPTAKAQK